ncbi:hypothetical protein AY601_0937 [Pedobacter cryoconitis]|uniref:Uncharacterized protein n=1 Tax=Pedobacter cryoconitis TaxID=188932 RepID=A0A127V974_9SPHI|nr:hypothetical protein [Pedobacter cryoconitis]AMP97876.1 hypothetical protein AY601_0937 [Pedobacter cryoconitis]
MENNFFLYSETENKVQIERFHICTWEFKTIESFVEFGCEINKESLAGNDNLKLNLSISWLKKECKVKDLYLQLYDTANSRFIFNDSVLATTSLDGGANRAGIIHNFEEREDLCILPVVLQFEPTNKLSIEIDLKSYNKQDNKPNVYFRFYIMPKGHYLSTRKLGINKSTIIYDTKINERRNIPIEQNAEFLNKKLCNIKSCFSFNILPNRFDMMFSDTSLKNVRTLEHSSFHQYLGKLIDIPKDELMVVFNKKDNLTAFTFFSIYTDERIGPAQFIYAILVNIICGILLFIPSYRKSFHPEMKFINVWGNLPVEIYTAIFLVCFTLVCFLWPTLKFYTKSLVQHVFYKN